MLYTGKGIVGIIEMGIYNLFWFNWLYSYISGLYVILKPSPLGIGLIYIYAHALELGHISQTINLWPWYNYYADVQISQ